MRIDAAVSEAAARYGDRTAFDLGHAKMTYAEMTNAVEAVAAGLRRVARPGERIALCMAKTPDAVIAMLAVLRAGMTYVPIDPRNPAERRRHILDDSSARVLLVDERTRDTTRRDRAGVSRIWTVGELLENGGDEEAAAHTGESMDQAAYILYTSGSTGTPKGVVITHGNAASFVQWASRGLPLDPRDRLAVLAPLHFDLAVYDIYVGLSAGATLCLVPERTAMFGQSLLSFISEMEITVVYGVPSALGSLVDRVGLEAGQLDTLRRIMYAGEEFNPNALTRLMKLAPGARVFNLYGPVETNVVTWFEVPRFPHPAQRVPIGKPVDHANVILLSEQDTVIIEPGRIGQIGVWGGSVTPGYLNMPERNGSVFRSVTVDGITRRTYLTGDFAQWDQDGVLHFHGRRDGLVKIRGFRVELGEVETVLGCHPAVQQAAVVAVENTSQRAAMHAFVSLRKGETTSPRALEDHCRDRLPPYMVPQRVWIRESLPLTSTSKVARELLIAELRTTSGPV